jgi:hypothetical protein
MMAACVCGGQLLSFVHLSASGTTEQQSAALSKCLLEAVLCNCPNAVDAIMQPVSWGAPEVASPHPSRECERGHADHIPYPERCWCDHSARGVRGCSSKRLLITSHRITSALHRIASHRIASHRIASNRI